MKINLHASFEDRLLGAPLSTSLRPMSKYRHTLSVARQSWCQSRLRIVVEEVRNFPLRIAAFLRNPTLASGATVPPCPSRFQDWGYFFLGPNSYLNTCTRDMRELQKENSWMGMGDVQLALQAWRRGVEWG